MPKAAAGFLCTLLPDDASIELPTVISYGSCTASADVSVCPALGEANLPSNSTVIFEFVPSVSKTFSPNADPTGKVTVTLLEFFP